MIFTLVLRTSFNFEDEIIWNIFQTKANNSGLLVCGKTLSQKIWWRMKEDAYANVCACVHTHTIWIHTYNKEDHTPSTPPLIPKNSFLLSCLCSERHMVRFRLRGGRAGHGFLFPCHSCVIGSMPTSEYHSSCALFCGRARTSQDSFIAPIIKSRDQCQQTLIHTSSCVHGLHSSCRYWIWLLSPEKRWQEGTGDASEWCPPFCGGLRCAPQSP